MGFWKSLGKGLLKVAPIAASFIPGVGIPLGMAIAGATNAASAKASGGSWKDALLSGGIGAGMGAVGAGALKGIGPSSGIGGKLLGGVAGKTGLGATGAIGSALGQLGTSAATNAVSGMGAPEQMPPQAGGLAPSAPPPMNPFGQFGSSPQRRRLGFGNV